MRLLLVKMALELLLAILSIDTPPDPIIFVQYFQSQYFSMILD